MLKHIQKLNYPPLGFCQNQSISSIYLPVEQL
jgi:hypothetical protein